MAELIFLFGSAALTIPFYLMSAVPFYGSERIRISRIIILLISCAMFRPIAQFIIILTVAEAHIGVWLDIFNYFFVVIIWFIILFACFKAHAVKLLYAVLLQRMLFQSINGIAFRIVELFMPENSHQLHFERFWLLWTGVYLALTAFIVPFVHRLSKGVLQHELANLPMKNILLLSVSPTGFYLAAAVYTFVFGLFSNDLIALFIIIMGLSFSLFQILTIRNTRKLLITEMKHSLLLNNYQTLESHFTQIAQMKHDMRNHLSMLRVFLKDNRNEEAKSYLEKYADEVDEITEAVCHENYLINAVAHDLLLRAKSLGVETVLDLKASPLFISEPDLISLLTNITNNALEACAKLPEERERLIKLSIARREPYLVIVCENSNPGGTVSHGNEILTSKTEAGHGYGLNTIKRIAASYGGMTEISYDETIFTITVALKDKA
jgi:hypothetical protein